MNIFDGHSDLWEDVDEKRRRGLRQVIRTVHQPRWEAGGVEGGFYPVWVDPEGMLPPVRQAESIFRQMAAELEECGDLVQVVRTAEEYSAAVRAGKHALILGAEGLSFLEGDLSRLEDLYRLGLREASLTWNETNDLAAGAGDSSGQGLTSLGRDCVREIHRLGMILDLAHASRQTFWDAMELTDGPFMVSHGSCKALCPHPRNYSDDQIRAIAQHNGVLGINAYAPFLDLEEESQTVERYADHVAYAADLVGTDYVALGFDLVDFLDDVGTDPSISCVTRGLESLGDTGNLLNALTRRGFSREELEKICRGNFLRLVQML